MNYQEKLKDKFPKKKTRDEITMETPFVLDIDPREFEFALRKRLRTLSEDVLGDVREAGQRDA